jgi:hypothetical protein
MTNGDQAVSLSRSCGPAGTAPGPALSFDGSAAVAEAAGAGQGGKP